MSAPPIPPEFDIAEYGSGLQEAALQTTLKGLESNRTVSGLRSVLQVLRMMADGVETPSGECAPCRIGAMPKPLVSELAAIAAIIEGLDEQSRAALRARAEQYDASAMGLRDGRIHESALNCPFKVAGGCLIEGARPFDCRVFPVGEPTLADVAARSLEFGHAVGLKLLGLDHNRVELGATVKGLIDDPAWLERFLKGGHCFREEALIPMNRDPVTEYAKAVNEIEEPSGFPEPDPAQEMISAAVRQRGLRAGLDVNPGVTVAQQIMRLEMPYAYESEEEIDEWRSYYVETIQEVAELGLDPVEAFDALRFHSSFPIGYQGRDCKEILSERGDLLIAPIVAAALPDLVETIEPRRAEGKVRIGYLSAHMRNHAAALWIASWVQNHGPDVETFVFNTGPREDQVSLRFRRTADHYYFMPGDVVEAARFIKSLNLDVLVFTDIGMSGANDQYAAMRLAPIQCTGYGHPITSGLPTVDYFLSSEIMEAPNGEAHYREQIVRLPGSGLTMEPGPSIPLTRSRADYGLPEGHLVFMSQNPFKMVPRDDAMFARLSQELENPILFRGTRAGVVDDIYRRRWDKAGIRAIWLPYLSQDDFHQVMQLSDVIIDPPAWSGGYTTLEAISYRKPVVTLPGEFMRGRHSFAYLTQANMTPLIAKDADDFVRLVQDRDVQAAAIRQADPEGPLNDLNALRGFNEWLFKMTGR